MPFFDLDHNVDAQPALGKPTGFLENMQQAWRQQYQVDSQTAYQTEIQERWNSVIDDLEAQTGQTYARPGLSYTREYARITSRVGSELDRPQVTPGAVRQGVEPAFDPAATRKEMDKINEAAIAAGLPSFADVMEEVAQMQRKVEEQTSLMAETGGISGVAGQFLGGAAGSFTTRDPINLVTLPMGGVGKTIAARVASEMVIAGGITAATEYLAVQPNRQAAGLQERSSIPDILGAAVGAGVLSVAGELVARQFRLRATRRAQADYDARVQGYLLDNPQSPRARGALHLIELDEKITTASPYGQSRAGLRRFTAELDEVASLMSGQTSTAIARALPPVPFEQLSRVADFEIVKERVPEVYGRMELAQADVVRLDSEIAALENVTDSLGAAIERIDPESGALVRSFEEDLENPQLTRPQREDIERRVTQIVESLGTDNVRAAMSGAEAATKQGVRRLRASRRAANKRYREAAGAVEAERVRMAAEARVLEAGQQRETVDLLGNMYRHDTAPPIFQGSSLSYDVVARQSDTLKRMSEISDDEAVRIVDAEQGDLLDIGLANGVDPNTRFVDMEGREVTFGQVMKELAEDRKLDEAVRTCAL